MGTGSALTLENEIACPRMAQHGRREAQDGRGEAKISQDGPKRAQGTIVPCFLFHWRPQDGPNMALSTTKMAPRWLKMALETSQDGPRTSLGTSWDHLGVTLGHLVGFENGDFAWEILKKRLCALLCVVVWWCEALCVVVCCCWCR